MDDDFRVDISGPQNDVSDQHAFSVHTGGLGLIQEEAVVTDPDISIDNDELVVLPREQEDQSMPVGDDASLLVEGITSFNLDNLNDAFQAISPATKVCAMLTRRFKC